MYLTFHHFVRFFSERFLNLILFLKGYTLPLGTTPGCCSCVFFFGGCEMIVSFIVLFHFEFVLNHFFCEPMLVPLPLLQFRRQVQCR